jgi:ribonucleoside-diphosphate reductase alpha chain
MSRSRLPAIRSGLTRVIRLRHPRPDGTTALLRIYITTGTFEDGRLGEVFIKADRSGSTISGLLDALSITASVALQHGAPVETLVEKWSRMQFEPAGTTDVPEMRQASSIVDVVARWLAARYCR